MKQTDFNSAIASTKDTDDDEMRRWVTATFGRRAAGEAVESSETLPTTCPICGAVSDAIAKRRRNAAYLDDKENWLVSCQGCFDRDWDRLQEDWDDYNSGRL